MRDPEFIELRNKFFLGIFIFLIFAIPIFFFIKNKLFISDSNITKAINNKKTYFTYDWKVVVRRD